MKNKSGGSIRNIVSKEYQKTYPENRVQDELKDQQRIEESKFWSAK